MPSVRDGNADEEEETVCLLSAQQNSTSSSPESPGPAHATPTKLAAREAEKAFFEESVSLRI